MKLQNEYNRDVLDVIPQPSQISRLRVPDRHDSLGDELWSGQLCRLVVKHRQKGVNKSKRNAHICILDFLDASLDFVGQKSE